MSWALVTGGSRGIGAAISEALAKRKQNLMLVARNQKDLADISERLQMIYGIRVQILSCDLKEETAVEELIQWIEAGGESLNIFCHVAGMGGAKDFGTLSPDEMKIMIRTNFERGVELCWRLVPLLRKNAPAHILLVGSMAGFAPVPQKAIYSATKSAVYFFSRSLNQILKNDRIEVSCLSPGPVFTKSSIKQETIKQLGKTGEWMALSPDQIGETAIRQMLKGKPLIVPGKLNQFISALMRTLPHSLLMKLFSRRLNDHSPKEEGTGRL
jgi:short-subunit dehydrogenase